MATNLRALAEKSLETTLEGGWASPVILTGPDGIKYEVSNNGGAIRGQVLYDTVDIDVETGQRVIVGHPVVTLRRSSLPRIPFAGETWVIKIPQDPTAGAPMVNYTLDPSRPPYGGRSLGFIKLPLRRMFDL